MDTYHTFSLTRPIYYLTQLNDSFIIQLIAVYAMYMLVENVKLIDNCLIGVLLLKHKTFISKLLKVSGLVMLLSKLFAPLINKLSHSQLPLEFANSSVCTNLNVCDLSAEIRDTFYVELNNYVLDNSLLYHVFPFVLFLFFLFFFFLIFHCIWEKMNIYKCDLDMVKIEQHLLKYYSYLEENKSNNSLAFNANQNDFKNEEENKCKNALNWITWKPFYYMHKSLFGKSRCELAMEKIKRMCELNEFNEI